MTYTTYLADFNLLRFDNAWWGGVLGQAHFNEVFGTLLDPATGIRSLTASQQSAGTALGTAGIAVSQQH